MHRLIDYIRFIFNNRMIYYTSELIQQKQYQILKKKNRLANMKY